MKYIKKFEGRAKHSSQGFRKKLKSNFSNFEKSKKFIPAEYIVFEYGATNPGDEFNNWRSLIFGKINKVESYMSDLRYDIDDVEKDYYLFAFVIDFVTREDEINIDWMKIDQIKSFNIQLVNTLYTSASGKDAQEKYNLLSEEYRVRMDAKKYNL